MTAATRIQYLTSSPGIRLAYWTVGKGPALVCVAPPITSNVNLELEWPAARESIAVLSSCARVTRFDLRNAGLSTRHVPASFEEMLCDVEAVIERVADGPVMLFGGTESTKLVLRYAATHPGRVSRMVLWNPYPCNTVGREPAPGVDALTPLIDSDWPLYTELVGTIGLGLDDPDRARWLARSLRESCDPGDVARVMRALREYDASEDARNVSCPALLLYRPTRFFDLESCRFLASVMPDARLAVLGPGGVVPWEPDAMETVAAFLREQSSAAEETGLTARELEVLRALAHGRSNREIGESLVLSERTVERHVANIYAKIDARNRAEATAFAVKHGLG